VHDGAVAACVEPRARADEAERDERRAAIPLGEVALRLREEERARERAGHAERRRARAARALLRAERERRDDPGRRRPERPPRAPDAALPGPELDERGEGAPDDAVLLARLARVDPVEAADRLEGDRGRGLALDGEVGDDLLLERMIREPPPERGPGLG